MPEWFKDYLDGLNQERAEELYDWICNQTRSAQVENEILSRITGMAMTDRRPY